jgi:hypothetical protein
LAGVEIYPFRISQRAAHYANDNVRKISYFNLGNTDKLTTKIITKVPTIITYIDFFRNHKKLPRPGIEPGTFRSSV